MYPRVVPLFRLLILILGFIGILVPIGIKIANSSQPGFGILKLSSLLGGLLLTGISILPKAIFLNSLIFIASLAVALCMGEAFLRFQGPSPFAIITRLSDRYLYEYIPNTQKLVTRDVKDGGDRIVVHINSRGFRDGEFDVPKKRKRIVLYGDSFAANEASDLPLTIAKQLEVLLQKKGLDIEVLNGGVAGYGPDQSYRRIIDQLETIQPDIVVFQFYAGNDYGDLLRNKIYSVGSDDLLREHPLAIDEDLKRQVLFSKLSPYLFQLLKQGFQGFYGQILPNSVPTWVDTNVRTYEEYIVHDDKVIRDMLLDYYDADVAVHPESDSARYKVRLMGAIIRAMGNSLRQRGIPFVTVIVPAGIDVCEHYHLGEISSQEYPSYDPTRLTSTIEQFATDAGIPCLNFYQDFKSVDCKYYFRGNDLHWNDLGQARGAELLERFLFERGVL